MRAWTLPLVVACAPQADGLPADSDSTTDPGTLTVEVDTPFVAVETVFTVRGALPGDPVYVALGATTTAPCETGPHGLCWDLARPVVSDALTPDNGEAVLRFTFPKGSAGTFVLQAMQGSRRSGTTPIEVQGLGVDRDADGVSDAVEHLLGMDATSPDSDNDGILDDLDIHPTTPDAPSSFEVDDVEVVGASVGMVDPEFSADGQITWQTARGEEAWIAAVDPTTGALVPDDGRGAFLADDMPPMRIYKNGPEWVETADGPAVVFARRGQDGPDQLHIATHGVDGWAVAPIAPALFGGGVFGTATEGDADPALLWLGPRGFAGGEVRWRPLDGEGAGSTVQMGVAFGHFVQGARAYVGPITDEGGTEQAAIFDLDTQTITPITQTAWPVIDAYGWVDDEVLHVALFRRPPLGADHLEVWTRGEDGWTTTLTHPLPQGFPLGYSVEPFRWQGQTYLTYMTSTDDDPADGVIWVAGSAPNQLAPHRISGIERATRRDPEPVTHGARPWIYYSLLDGFDRAVHRTRLPLPDSP